jgi:multimeric flavodoxin WrbA
MLTILSSLTPSALKTVTAHLSEQGLAHRAHDLSRECYAPCQGCFNCWLVHPGTCKIHDHANVIMKDIVSSEAVLWLTRPRFGAWDPVAKAALDRTAGLFLPFFQKIGGETHHRRRYRHYPRWAVVAESTCPQGSEWAAFRTLVNRNVLNQRGFEPGVVGVPPGSAAELRSAITRALKEARQSVREVHAQVEPLPPVADATGPKIRPRRHVLLWVGSAKTTGQSTSESLGYALVRRLENRGWTSEVTYSSRAIRLRQARKQSLVAAAREADLVVLSSPVYIGCLPSLVLKGLADLVDGAAGPGPAILPVIQCGYPEVSHTRLSVEIILRAAREAGWPFAGHLAMGAGGFIGGRDIDSSIRFRRLQTFFDQVANALHAGQPVPAEVTEALAIAPLNPTLYRWIGQAAWLAESVKRGTLSHLWDRPFADD